MSEQAFISRAEADALREDYLVPISGWKPSIWGFCRDGRRYLVKDSSSCAWLFRNTIGLLAVARERRIYRKLNGLGFVPDCKGKLDLYGLVFERIAGSGLRDNHGRGITPAFFDSLERCIVAMHDRGVVHLDLGHRGNVLVSPKGEPILLDFEASLYLGQNRFSRRLLHPLFAWADCLALTKYRLRYVPEVVSVAQAKRFRHLRFWRRFWPSWRIWPPRRLGSRRIYRREGPSAPADRGGSADPR